MEMVLWLFVLLGVFGFVTLLYYSFNIAGLFGWIAVIGWVVTMHLQNLVEIFGYSFTLGNIFYATAFLASDILCENHGRKAAYLGVGFAIAIFFIMNVIVNLPATIKLSNTMSHISDIVELVFSRTMIAGVLSYSFAQLLNIKLYIILKKSLPQKRYLWVRNNISTILAQLLDSVIFTGIMMFNIASVSQMISIMLAIFVIKLIFALLDTPWIYVAKAIGLRLQDRASALDWMR